MTNQIKYYSLNSLPNSAEIGAIYYLSNGSQYIGTSSNTFLPISDFIFVDEMPSIGILDKIYVHKEADKTSLKIWSGTSFELLSGSEYDDSAILQAISTLQSELSTVQGKVTTVESKIVTNEGKISALETKVNELENNEVDLTPLQNDIAALTTKTNDIESDVSTLQDEITSKGNVKSVNGNVADENGNVTITIDTVEPYDDTELRGKVAVNEGKISTLETKVEELKNTEIEVDFSPIQTQIDVIESSLSTHESKSVLDENGAHNFKVVDDTLFVFENDEWRQIEVIASVLPQAKAFKSTVNADDTITISWSNPTNTEFLRTQLYVSTLDISGLDIDDMDGMADVRLVSNGTSESYIHNGTYGVTYYFKLFTIHELFGSETVATPSVITSKIVDITPPDVVTNVKIVSGDGTLSVTWTNPADQDLGNVRLNYDIGAINSINDGTMAFNGTGNSVTIEGLVNDTEYALRFFTIDNNGNVNDDASMIYNGKPNPPSLKYYDIFTTIGATETLDGAAYNNAGYFGTVTASELFTGTELANAVGITKGTVQHDNTEWLKFYIDGKIIFKSIKPIRHSLNWTTINDAGCAFGEKTVFKNGITFKVLLMKSATSDPVTITNTEDNSIKYSEWNRLILPIHEKAISGEWGTYKNWVEKDVPNWNVGLTDTDLVLTNTAGSGSWQWGQENVTQDAILRYIARGARYGAAYVEGGNNPNPNTAVGWSPVLEVIPPSEGGN